MVGCVATELLGLQTAVESVQSIRTPSIANQYELYYSRYSDRKPIQESSLIASNNANIFDKGLKEEVEKKTQTVTTKS